MRYKCIVHEHVIKICQWQYRNTWSLKSKEQDLKLIYKTRFIFVRRLVSVTKPSPENVYTKIYNRSQVRGIRKVQNTKPIWMVPWIPRQWRFYIYFGGYANWNKTFTVDNIFYLIGACHQLRVYDRDLIVSQMKWSIGTMLVWICD